MTAVSPIRKPGMPPIVPPGIPPTAPLGGVPLAMPTGGAPAMPPTMPTGGVPASVPPGTNAGLPPIPPAPMLDRTTKKRLVSSKDQQQANMDTAKGKSAPKKPAGIPFLHEQKGL